MKITGLTIVRNAVLNNFPVLEAISSILPVVDEMIVSIDKGEDDTDALIRSINSDKLKIVYSTWDMSLRKGGQVYAIETNKAIQHVSADTDWIFYIQADEVIHEKYHPAIRQTAEKYCREKQVDGLLFKYVHFFGTYDYVGDSRQWYQYEIRMIKNDKTISSFKDAQGFRRNGKKINVVKVDAEVYHYGWVKSPAQMKKKMDNIIGFYQENDKLVKEFRLSSDVFDFNDFESLRKFEGTHPQVMQKRIAQKDWNLQLDINRKRVPLKDRILLLVEKLTGKRLFVFKNYKIIRVS